MKKTHQRVATLGCILSIALSGFGTGCVRSSSENVLQSEFRQAKDGGEEGSPPFDSIKCLTPAPQWYKQLWLDLNGPENELGRALMTHYMGCTGKPYKLNLLQFRSLPVAFVEAEINPLLQFAARGEELRKVGENPEDFSVEDFDDSVLVSTHYGNTLGHFHLHLKGRLKHRKNEFGKLVARFEGVARVEDRYDFDPSPTAQKESWRGNDTELRVRIAHIAMPGRAFEITSDDFPLNIDIPLREGELIQRSENDEKSGYSNYGEQVQLVLMTELRSARWEKASTLQRISILAKLMKRLHDAVVMRR